MKSLTISMLAEAHNAISNGELVRAQQLLLEAQNASPACINLDVVHTLAVVERKLGHLDTASVYFETVLGSCPDEPIVLNNYANCLRDMDDIKKAESFFRRALELKPDYTDAALNLGLLLKNSNQLQKAEEEFNRSLKFASDNASLWHGLSMVLRELGRLDEAADTLDRALAITPMNPQILHARARVESERGKPSVTHYARALAAAPDEPEIVLGSAVASFENGDSQTAIRDLQELTRCRPEWVKGHVALAQIRWQMGDTQSFAQSFEEALQSLASEPLYIGYFSTLMRAGLYHEVLQRVPAARIAINAPYLLDRYEAVCASEASEIDRADPLFLKHINKEDMQLQLAYLRHLLRKQCVEQAAALAEKLVQRPDAMAVWPYLSIAWRLMGDARTDWLDAGARLIASFDFEESVPGLGELARKLRAGHHARSHPFDQSMRHGSQSQGNLFLRSDPGLVEMRHYINAGIEKYIQQLPARDSNHPFLKHARNRFHIEASYSVCLQANGFHVNHNHPEAAISCCFYVETPDSIGAADDDPSGWLVIGQPPEELGVDLNPITHIRPKPGRLAIFPSIMWHGTVPFPDGERLTVVSDICFKE